MESAPQSLAVRCMLASYSLCTLTPHVKGFLLLSTYHHGAAASAHLATLAPSASAPISGRASPDPRPLSLLQSRADPRPLLQSRADPRQVSRARFYE